MWGRMHSSVALTQAILDKLICESPFLAVAFADPLRHMRGHSDPSGALLLGCGLGLWTFFKGFRVMREYKVLEDTPRIPIRSVPMGFVHIRGKAESAEVLSSPVSHTPCCFYKI